MRRLHEARNAAKLLTIEGDITGRFLGVGGEPGILDNLGRNARHILNGQMYNSSMLCHRSVSVTHHPFLMKTAALFLGCGKLCYVKGRCAEAGIEVDVTFLNKLQAVAPQALPTPAKPRPNYLSASGE